MRKATFVYQAIAFLVNGQEVRFPDYHATKRAAIMQLDNYISHGWQVRDGKVEKCNLDPTVPAYASRTVVYRNRVFWG